MSSHLTAEPTDDHADDNADELMRRATRAQEKIAANYERHMRAQEQIAANQVEAARHWRAERRERIATAVFQGMLSNPEVVGSPHEIAACAARYADILIAQLDKESQP
jgi:alkanesulfonate monooxygenase SsuD/methylene tetrahydromethanopterin reductase-like flavin-dependent oxidoreductase (luciferase family)